MLESLWCGCRLPFLYFHDIFICVSVDICKQSKKCQIFIITFWVYFVITTSLKKLVIFLSSFSKEIHFVILPSSILSQQRNFVRSFRSSLEIANFFCFFSQIRKLSKIFTYLNVRRTFLIFIFNTFTVLRLWLLLGSSINDVRVGIHKTSYANS